MLTRFAPSPTGYLHVGNIRTALICWLYARSQNGKFLLRLDDTDLQRSDSKYIDGIIEDLKWIGIDWDASFKQSERFERYDEVFLQLIKDERIYACYETKEELETKRKLQLKRGLPPVYDRSALTAQKKIQEGRSPYFRFKLDSNEVVKWSDKIKGEISILANSVSDPVVRREDGNYTYMLPSIIDDIDFQVTHIVRGEDHLTNTAVQIQMIQALKAKVPTFAHLSLLHFDNNKISKRVGGLDIRSIKEDGIESMALSSYLTKLGTSDSIEAHINTQSLIDTFNIEKFSSASTQFNLNEVYQLNSKVLQKMSFEVMKERLQQTGIDSAEFWYFIRGNIDKFSDVNEWWQICKSHINPIILNKEFIKIALDMLPQGNFDENTLSEWVKAIRQKVDIKTKDLFIQLRLALTGKEAGPELAKLLIFIGRERIITRLK
ncbi:MAG TPA: glutamate--tRNA ligase [Wolbachia sp.]|jgi:glutamyl-tRNA synthetase|uniref:glutamate--tRNA ligase n=1 Tax=Wolbachia endosymbiont of Pentalonia nigronervosa TaxID=1301914 RepID=UPI000EEA5AE5|nr:glutamate--tRNA ligase [Wolbachia endosymbiont of Pentalonia nigronervosa]MBD0391630.1 glutamate--tRNA ligase [Wolbachia endosymbiont of Pentalonia nigronervosa]HCE59375.1 glutamate--tRNA ligase [Wolbachia sp.]